MKKVDKEWFLIFILIVLVTFFVTCFTSIHRDEFLVRVDSQNRVDVVEGKGRYFTFFPTTISWRWLNYGYIDYIKDVKYEKNDTQGIKKVINDKRIEFRFKDGYLAKLNVSISYKIPNWSFLQVLLSKSDWGYSQEEFENKRLRDFVQKATETLAAKTDHDAKDFKELLYYEFLKDSPDAISVDVLGDKLNLEFAHVLIGDLEIISEGIQ